MKKLLFLLLSILSVHFCIASVISVQVIDAFTKKPLAECLVELHITGLKVDSIYTDTDGHFSFDTDSVAVGHIHLLINTEGYLKKSYSRLKPDMPKKLTLRLRSKSDTPDEFPTLDSTWIGSSLKKACKEFRLEEGDYKLINEPSGMGRGIYFHKEDGTFITFYIEKKGGMRDTRKLMKQEITGVAIFSADCKTKKYYGEGMPWIGVVGSDCE